MIAKYIKNALKKITPLYAFYKYIMNKKQKTKEVKYSPEFITKQDELSKIVDDFKSVTIFIETGTYFGDTIEYFKNRFEQLYSIELSESLANKAIERFRTETHIKIIAGNSDDQIGKVLTNIASPCLFWLDGHYSTEFWVGKEYIITAKGNKNTPIMKELKQIAKHGVREHIILIDDARFFIGKNDYPSLAKLKKFTRKNWPNHSFEVKNDIIRIFPSQIVDEVTRNDIRGTQP